MSLLDTIKTQASKWWFYASAIGLAALYFLFDSRGKKIQQLTEEVMKMQLGEKLKDLNQQANQSQEGFQNAQKNYQNLINTHGDLLTKLGVSHTVPGDGTSAGTGQDSTK